MTRENSGLITLNGNAAGLKQKTIIVIGSGRGGTSMVAGVLSKLGIYMGEQLSSRYQDSILIDCINGGNKKQAKRIIHERNEKHSVWGVKKIRLWYWDKLFRKPVYIVVFRDIFAIANRQANIGNSSLLLEMFNALGKNLLIMIFLCFCKRPILIVSYEKCLINPENFVLTLSKFLGLSKSEKHAEAIKFIQPSPSAYISTPVFSEAVQKSGQYLGFIDSIEKNKVIGWALSKSNINVVEMELFVNGICKGKAITHIARPDVFSEYPESHENSGFIFQLSKKDYLQVGDKVDVRFSQEGINLINSPQDFNT